MDPHVVVTPGDPRGIGPEVAVRAIQSFSERHPSAAVTVMGPDGPMPLHELQSLGTAPDADITAPDADSTADADAGRFAAGAIERAVEMARGGGAHAIVTGPVHKPSLHAAGWNVPGQTEMLAQLVDAPRVGMLMAAEETRLGGPLRVLLATTHISLREVPRALNTELIVQQAQLLHQALRCDWGIPEPRLALCGLNPHASDGGLFGDEEATVFAPAVARLQEAGVTIGGPLPADTVFGRALQGEFDAVVAPYHDVGMAAFKTAAFGSGVNVTLGLPFIRTSPDHGTAFDIAGSGTADSGSMLTAIALAHRLSKKRFDTPHADL